jgi:hypothetical protein
LSLQKTRARLVDCVPKGEKDSLITQEAAAAMGASHPHLVTTYKYAIKYHEKGAVQTHAQVQEDGKPLLPGTCECWLFMEMCNKGTLQVLSSLPGLFVHPKLQHPMIQVFFIMW